MKKAAASQYGNEDLLRRSDKNRIKQMYAEAFWGFS